MYRDLGSDSDEYIGIHLHFWFGGFWEWKGSEFGWVFLRAMVSPWWGETKKVAPQEAFEFLASRSSSEVLPMDLLKVSERKLGELEEWGLPDEVLSESGFARTGLVIPDKHQWSVQVYP